jgi:outer membrane protein OmpA-like peptidoglycan-associated protein
MACAMGVGAVLFAASTAIAQSAPPQSAPPSQSQTPAASSSETPTRPATTTVKGDTGLWYVPTAEVLPAKKWSFSVSRLEVNDGQGFSNISTFPISFGVGIGGRVEVFGSWQAITRIDRDTRPLFFSDTSTPGTGGGIGPDYPLNRATFTGNKRGDLWLGGKFNVRSQADHNAIALAIRPMVKFATGDKVAGTTSGKTDFAIDAIVSRETGKSIELSGYGGYMSRGNPDGYDLTNGFRWGFGAGFPSRSPVRVSAELYGEAYSDHTITAPAGLFGADGSPVPVSSTIKSPVYLNLGVTFQAKNGFFFGAGANWNLTMPSRSDASAAFPDDSMDAADYQLRIGFHPGVRKHVPPPPPPPPPAPAPAPAPPPAAAPPVNHPPTVRASCEPCTVEVGKTSTVTADGQDPDGDTLTYQWRANAGTLTSPTSRVSPWTAPMVTGPVPFTVTVSDGKGGTASANVTIEVIKTAVKVYAFEDVHFDFDRSLLRPDALRVLDEAVAAMKADPALTLSIEGHTCDIGTAEYNLALGERRAKVVVDYFTSRGIDAGRLRSVSFGEESPKYDNSREETRRLNRRAALVVTLGRN